MKLQNGNKLICVNTIKNVLEQTLFKEGEIYNVLYIDGDDIILDHNLYGNEYVDFFSKQFIEKNFRTLKET